MASRNFNSAQNLEKEVKTLFADVAIGAAGAPTLTKGLGVTSIAKTDTGDYTITLDDKYVRLMHVSVMQVEADDEDLTFQVASESVSSNKTIAIICKAAATPADPSNGSRLLIRIDLKNSTSGE